MNSPQEKLLDWNYRNGFRSEDSDDEITVYKRTQRQYYRGLKREHGENATLLCKRPIHPFERLMLNCCGGHRLFKDLLGKSIEDESTVYDYVRTQDTFESSRSRFLEVADRDSFKQRYCEEREN